MQLSQKLKYVFILLLFCTLASKGFAQSQVDTVQAVTDTISNYDDELEDVTVTQKVETEAVSTDGNFAQRNYSDTTVTLRSAKTNQWNTVVNSNDFWYVNGEKKMPPKKVEKDEVYKENSFWKNIRMFFNSDAFRVLAWILIVIGFIAIIISYLISNDIILVKAKSRKLNNAEDIETEIPNNIFEINFETHIAKALAVSNYRLATRLMFLQTIKTMSNKSIINYAADKTNFDYLMQLSGTKYFSLFSKASLNYEYTWYGNFNVNEQQFATIKNSIQVLNQSISN
jgi:hypothetical protein